jgi:SAM-dependent methyltransferase
MNNHDYLLKLCAERQGARASARFLDYGCGAGEIVERGVSRGLDFHGCDVFYEGGDYSSRVPASLIEARRVLRMDDGKAPYPDQHFDVIVSNEVIEHVADLDAMLREIKRLLRPGGVVISIFPHREVWREGHCGIPFLHWFPVGSRPLRVWYAFGLRCLGLGNFTDKKTRWQWAEDFCLWLDNWTHYRSEAEIHAAFAPHFSQVRHIEADFLDNRLENLEPVMKLVPTWAKGIFVRKMAGLVLEARV